MDSPLSKITVEEFLALRAERDVLMMEKNEFNTVITNLEARINNLRTMRVELEQRISVAEIDRDSWEKRYRDEKARREKFGWRWADAVGGIKNKDAKIKAERAWAWENYYCEIRFNNVTHAARDAWRNRQPVEIIATSFRPSNDESYTNVKMLFRYTDNGYSLLYMEDELGQTLYSYGDKTSAQMYYGMRADLETWVDCGMFDGWHSNDQIVATRI